MRPLNTRYKYIAVIGIILISFLIYDTSGAGWFGRTLRSFSNFSCHVFNSGCGGGGGGGWGGGGKFVSLIRQAVKNLTPVTVTLPVPTNPTAPTTQKQNNAPECFSRAGDVCVSPPNSCGQTGAAKYLCDGSCFATPPPDSSCAPPAMTTNSARFNRGSSCTITWSAQNATSCTLTGPGVSASGISGTISTPPLQATTAYTLTCFNGSVVSATQTIICRLNPEYVEF